MHLLQTMLGVANCIQTVHGDESFKPRDKTIELHHKNKFN